MILGPMYRNGPAAGEQGWDYRAGSTGRWLRPRGLFACPLFFVKRGFTNNQVGNARELRGRVLKHLTIGRLSWRCRTHGSKTGAGVVRKFGQKWELRLKFRQKLELPAPVVRRSRL